MLLHEDSETLVQAYDALYRLGATANYIGFFYASYAIWLCAREPERLQLVTKWLYPDVAEHYGTNWKAVERNIRALIGLIWSNNPKGMCELAGFRLTKKPRPGQFLAFMARSVQKKE